MRTYEFITRMREALDKAIVRTVVNLRNRETIETMILEFVDAVETNDPPMLILRQEYQVEGAIKYLKYMGEIDEDDDLWALIGEIPRNVPGYERLRAQGSPLVTKIEEG